MTGFFNFLFFSLLVFIVGFFLCFFAILFSIRRTKISKTTYTYFCSVSAIVFSTLFTLSFILKEISLTSFLIGIFCINFCFLCAFVFYRFLPNSPTRKIDISCGEEWLNLSYLLALIEKVSRYDLPTLEEEFFNDFKEKVFRMTTYNCYELPSSFELNRFYFLCNRLGVK